MDRQIGILGAGTIGAGVGQFFVRAGWHVAISGAHGPAALGGAVDAMTAGVANGPGPQAASSTRPEVTAVGADEAVKAEVVLLATPWAAAETALQDAPSWDGRILIDATNAIKVYAPPRVEVHDFGARTSSEVVAGLAPGARVVKAFNHLPFFQLAGPVPEGERRASFLCGDDSDAKADIAAVLRHNGFAPIDLGSLHSGSLLQQVGGPLASVDVRVADA
jgi:hypothetical protein